MFSVTILRSILDRLIYNDEYANLTDSNVGARKDRNIRDNIFVLNAISNSVIKGNEDDIDIQAGSLFCTATMDKLAKLIYNNKELVYK